MTTMYASTPTKAHLPTSHFDPFVSPSSSNHQQHTPTHASFSRRGESTRPAPPSASPHRRASTWYGGSPSTSTSTAYMLGGAGAGGGGREEDSEMRGVVDEDSTMTSDSPLAPSHPLETRSTSTQARMDSIMTGSSPGMKGSQVEESPTLSEGGWSPSPKQMLFALPSSLPLNQNNTSSNSSTSFPSTSAIPASSSLRHSSNSNPSGTLNFSYEESPIKPKAQLSHSRSLGRALGKGKRPASNVAGDRMRNSKSLAFDGDMFSAGMDEGGSRPREGLGLFAGMGGGRGGGGGADSEDEFASSSTLKPISFPTFGGHQRALTEQDLNSSSAGPSRPRSDNIFLAPLSSSSNDQHRPLKPTTSSVFLAPPSAATPFPTRTIRYDSMHPNSMPPPPSFLSVSSGQPSSSSSSSSHLLSTKKAVSLDNLNLRDGPSSSASFRPPSRSRRSSLLNNSGASSNSSGKGPLHRRTPSSEESPFNVGTSSSQHISRSSGHKSGLSAVPTSSQPPLQQSTSLSHLSVNHSSSHRPPNQANSKSDPSLNRSAPASFKGHEAIMNAKPLAAAFATKSALGRKFKPRDSGIALEHDNSMIDSPVLGHPPLPSSKFSLPHLNIPSSLFSGGRREDDELVTPGCEDPDHQSGWPAAGGGGMGGGPVASTSAFEFLGADVAEALANAVASQQISGGAKVMPDTPVKRSAFAAAGGKMVGGGGAGRGGHVGIEHHHQPHPLSLSIRPGAGSSSPSGPSAPTPRQNNASSSSSSNVLSMSHRPSSSKPSHLSSSSRSLIPTFKPANSFQVRVTQSSPEEHSGSSSPPPEAESPTILRKGKMMQTSSPGFGRGGEGGQPSFASSMEKTAPGRMNMLRRTSSGVGNMGWGGDGSESESGSGVEMTPTRRGNDGLSRTRQLPTSQTSPTHAPRRLPSLSANSSLSSTLSHTYESNHTHSHLPQSTPSSSPPHLAPRLSLPNFSPMPPAPSRRLHHRSSHPLPRDDDPRDDIYDTRFAPMEALGKGAFSEVWKVRDRQDGVIYAVKRTKGVFEGVKDRLRHLEEVDILRALSTPKPHPNVIAFVDAWEQSHQLFIQMELCELGNLAFFLEEYGRVVERLDEGRVWKIVRELSEGVAHIHSHDIIHLDLKPANIFITTAGVLKIGDFGLSTRCPRVDSATILRGAGLGGDAIPGQTEKGWEREGDRDYMALETMMGSFGKPADIFSLGLLILETATNIIVPANHEPWHALRSNNFGDVDLSPLSSPLSELIVHCMRADPAERPTADDICGHLIVQRSNSGKEALAPEPVGFLTSILTGGFEFDKFVVQPTEYAFSYTYDRYRDWDFGGSEEETTEESESAGASSEVEDMEVD